MSSNKKRDPKKLQGTLDQINKTYGVGSVLSGTKDIQSVETVSSGILSLDMVIGGGFPKGRVVEIYGPESSGKTTLTLHAIAEMQKQGGVAAFIDAEHAFDKFYAECLGIDMERLIFSQPDSGEQGLEITDTLIKSGEVDMIIVDSVAALTPKAEIDGEMGDSKMGLHARLMSQALRKMTASIGSTGCIVIFINQLREKIGVMFGNPETTTGGNALKFYASVRLDVRRRAIVKDGDTVSAVTTKVKVVKNKVAPPFGVCEFDILFGQGVLKESELLVLGVESSVIEQKGAWFSYEGTNIGKGKQNVINILKDNPELADELENKIKEYYAI
jgi:recombination protein RecA